MSYFIQQESIELIKSDFKDIFNVKNQKIPNKCCSFELSIHQRNLNKMYHCFHKNKKQHNCCQLLIDLFSNGLIIVVVMVLVVTHLSESGLQFQHSALVSLLLLCQFLQMFLQLCILGLQFSCLRLQIKLLLPEFRDHLLLGFPKDYKQDLKIFLEKNPAENYKASQSVKSLFLRPCRVE